MKQQFTAQDIRDEVRGVFAKLEAKEENLAYIEYLASETPRILADDRLTSVCDELARLTKNLLARKPAEMRMSAATRETVRELLTNTPYVIYPAWTLNERLSDEEVLKLGMPFDLGRGPRPEDREKLLAFRAKAAPKFVTANDFRPWVLFIDRIAGFCYAAAVLAKSWDDYAAAVPFIRAAQVLGFLTRKQQVFHIFTPDEIDTVLDGIEEGENALWIRRDYRALMTIGELRKHEAKRSARKGGGK